MAFVQAYVLHVYRTGVCNDIMLALIYTNVNTRAERRREGGREGIWKGGEPI